MKSNWLYKIQQHQATPPEGAWKNISNALDEAATETADFANRLSAFETAPPAKAAKNIFALLDAEDEEALQKKLYQYETAAPKNTWPHIADELDKTETKIVTLKPRTRRLSPVYLRVAAGIVLIAVISITAWVLNKQPSGNTETAGNIIQPKEINTVSTNTAVEKLPEATAKQNIPTVKHVVTDAPNVAALQVPEYAQHNQTITLAQNPATAKKEKLQNSNGETPEDVTLINSNTANAYVTITGPDGETVRVSSKFSALLNYLTEQNPETQENIEIIIKESAKWRATFSSWREKMINNSVAPSLTNFMDIIELSNILEEKK